MPSYIYSIETDFNGNLDPSQLYTEIDASVIIEAAFEGISTDGDVVSIIFTTSLTQTELDELNTIIANYETIPPQGYYSLPFDLRSDNTVTSTSFVTVASAVFSPNLASLTNFKVISNMESGGTNYTVQVYDETNDTVLASAVLTNTTSVIGDLGTVSNLPSDEAVLRLQAKVDGTSVAHIEFAVLYYD